MVFVKVSAKLSNLCTEGKKVTYSQKSLKGRNVKCNDYHKTVFLGTVWADARQFTCLKWGHLTKLSQDFMPLTYFFQVFQQLYKKKCGFHYEVKMTGISAAKLTCIITFETQSVELKRIKSLANRQEVDVMVHKVMRENKNIFLFQVHFSLVLTFFTRMFLQLPLPGAEIWK